MRAVIFLIIFNVGVYCQSIDDTTNINPSNCGERPLQPASYDPLKIVGGTEAIKGDWGWQSSLMYLSGFSCGGSLINSQWIVTAAHCVHSQTNPTYWSFQIGHHDRYFPESWSYARKVSKVIVHPGYSETWWRNDIALLKLDSPVTYSRNIIPICIPDDSAAFAGKTSIATGWGTTSSIGVISRYLLQVAMPWLTDADCKQKYPTVDPVNAICAGVEGGNKDTCQGDSGGPLVVQNGGKWFLGGITSWGYDCGDGGVYTRVSLYSQWIKDMVKNN